MTERESVLVSNAVLVGGVSSQATNKGLGGVLDVTSVALGSRQGAIFRDEVVHHVVVGGVVLNETTRGDSEGVETAAVIVAFLANTGKVGTGDAIISNTHIGTLNVSQLDGVSNAGSLVENTQGRDVDVGEVVSKLIVAVHDRVWQNNVAVGLDLTSIVGQVDQGAVVSAVKLDGLGLVVTGARVGGLNAQLLGVAELVLDVEVTSTQESSGTTAQTILQALGRGDEQGVVTALVCRSGGAVEAVVSTSAILEVQGHAAAVGAVDQGVCSRATQSSDAGCKEETRLVIAGNSSVIVDGCQSTGVSADFQSRSGIGGGEAVPRRVESNLCSICTGQATCSRHRDHLSTTAFSGAHGAWVSVRPGTEPLAPMSGSRR